MFTTLARIKIMTKFMKYWSQLEKNNYPYYLSKVHEIDFSHFQQRFNSASEINMMQKQFYNGEILYGIQ